LHSRREAVLLKKRIATRVNSLGRSIKTIVPRAPEPKDLPLWTMAGFTCLIAIWLVVIWKNPEADFHLAAIVQTLVFALGLIFTNISLRYLAKTTEFTKQLLQIEEKRDRQANSVCAWLSVEVRMNGTSEFLVGIASFMNASQLPVYDVSYRILYMKEGELTELPAEIGPTGYVTPVVSPTPNPRSMWVIDGTTTTEGRIVKSQDFFSSEKIQGDYYELQQLALTESELESLKIEISFRSVDGSKWKRLTSGRLESVFTDA